MTKDTFRQIHSLSFLFRVLCLALILGLHGCGQEPQDSEPKQQGPTKDVEGPIRDQEGPVRESPGSAPSGSGEPGFNQPALPRDSMVEAMLRIQLAEAYRARYYVLHAGATAEPPLMDSLYALALAPLGISPLRYEANYRRMLERDPLQLQALYDSCEAILQRRLIGLR